MRRLLLAAPIFALAFLLAPLPFISAAGADDIASAQAKANKAAKQLSDAQSTLGRLESEIADLEVRNTAARARLDGLKGSVRDLAVQQFINAGSIGGILTDEDINKGARADALSRSVTAGNQDAIDQYTAASQDLARTSAALAQRKGAQQSAVASLKKKQAALTAELARLQQLEAARKADAARKAAAAARLRGATRSGATGVIGSGPWICPVQGPVAFVDTWGAPRPGGRRHMGVDMMSPRGTPVVAPVAGRVEQRSNSLGGLSFHLFGDDGNYYYGAHLSAYASVPSHVPAGTVVGYVGNTGDASGGSPHLHFEIHPNGGAAVDPYPTVRKYC